MYPRRALLAEARAIGITILALDVNASHATWRAELLPGAPPRRAMRELATGRGLGAAGSGQRGDAAVPDARGWALRPSLSEVAGITDAQVGAIVAGRPWTSLGDLADRARTPRPVLEHLVAAGALDAVHHTAEHTPREHAPTRRDLLVALDERAATSPTGAGRGGRTGRAARVDPDQGALELGDPAIDVEVLGLGAMDPGEQTRAEVAAIGLDASRHLLAGYAPCSPRPRWWPARIWRAGDPGPGCWWPGSRSRCRPRRCPPGRGCSSSAWMTGPGRSTPRSSPPPSAPTPPRC